MESGSDATQGLEFFATVSGTVASSNARAYTGPRSIACQGAVNSLAFSSITAGRISGWFQKPTGEGGVAHALMYPSSTIGANAGPYVSFDTSDRLTLTDTSTVVQATSSALSLGVWYQLAYAFTRTSASVNRVKVWIRADGGSPTLWADLTDIAWGDAVSQ